jgi:hypothetical protein
VTGHTLDCGGGTLRMGERFTLNIQTSPVPPSGMGGQMYGYVGGSAVGTFTITGPP